MTRILLIGLEPSTVDYADPAIPPGTTAETIWESIKLMVADAAARGWHADTCLISPDATAVPAVERQLAAHRYDCVIVGGGVRLPAKNLTLFEAVVNAVHRGAPQSPIAFNTSPQEGVVAAARWIKD
jgi:hypothetical protein